MNQHAAKIANVDCPSHPRENEPSTLPHRRFPSEALFDHRNCHYLEGVYQGQFDQYCPDTWPRNPAGATYSIQDNTGQIVLDKRLQGNGSSYGRITPQMEIFDEGELTVRFRVDEMGNQRLRFWLQADSFSSGSTMPVNGYGVELNLNTDQFILRKREDNKSTNLDTVTMDLSTEDWHTLRLRIEDQKIMVQLWNE